MQAKVREIMYLGLVKLVLVDPLIAGTALDFLLPHFLHFYNEVAIQKFTHPFSRSQCIIQF